MTVNAPNKSVPAALKQKVQLEISSNIIAPNTVVELPEMETFEVELVKDQQGLGITIAGYVCERGNYSFKLMLPLFHLFLIIIR